VPARNIRLLKLNCTAHNLINASRWIAFAE
jgi:hypothetical protein